MGLNARRSPELSNHGDIPMRLPRRSLRLTPRNDSCKSYTPHFMRRCRTPRLNPRCVFLTASLRQIYQKQQRLSCCFCSRDSCLAVALPAPRSFSGVGASRSLDTKCLWCAGEDSNLQALRHQHLKLASLPNFSTRARSTQFFLFSLTSTAHHQRNTSRPPALAILFWHIVTDMRDFEKQKQSQIFRSRLVMSSSRKE